MAGLKCLYSLFCERSLLWRNCWVWRHTTGLQSDDTCNCYWWILPMSSLLFGSYMRASSEKNLLRADLFSLSLIRCSSSFSLLGLRRRFFLAAVLPWGEILLCAAKASLKLAGDIMIVLTSGPWIWILVTLRFRAENDAWSGFWGVKSSLSELLDSRLLRKIAGFRIEAGWLVDCYSKVFFIDGLPDYKDTFERYLRSIWVPIT